MPDGPALRTCLRCGKKFKSKGYGNRICNKCGVYEPKRDGCPIVNMDVGLASLSKNGVRVLRIKPKDEDCPSLDEFFCGQ